MAYYKYQQYVVHKDHAEFDKVYNPGALTVTSGIYKCVTCGWESVSTENHPLPPQDHHQHPRERQGPVRWRLVVAPAHHAINGAIA